jgi:cephalosporin hydroxylase
MPAPRGSQRLELIEGDSHDPGTLERVRELVRPGSVDLLFVDGDHTYEGVRADFELYGPLVRPGGLIAFHDVLPHSQAGSEVDRFWREIRSGCEHWESSDAGDVGFRGVWGGIGVLRQP